MRQEHQSEAEREDEEGIRWWRPDLGIALAEASRGWIAALVGLAILSVLFLAVAVAGLATPLAGFLVNLALLLAGATVAVGIYIYHEAVKRRREPFCIFCGYNLSGLPDHYRCPECGRDYTFEMIDDYRRDPDWFISRWKMRQNLPEPDRRLDVPADAPRRRSRDGT